MRKHFLLSLTLFYCIALWAIDASYYSSLNGKKDAALREAITALVYQKHTTAVGYTWDFDDIDVVDGVVLDMYSTCSWTSSQQGRNYSGICDGYNREHVVPQSLFEEKSPQVGDRHHLFLTDGQVNNKRSSYPFGETNVTTAFSGFSNGDKALGKLGAASKDFSGTVYEPDDEYKGDIARAILYMAVRYATTNECRAYGSGSTNSYPVTSWSNSMFSGSLSTNYGLSDAAVATYLRWHRNDKVSLKDIARNTGVENLQGNRNPFVDYPILVEYLWGNKKGETFYLTDAVGSFSGDFVPGVSDGSIDGGGSSATQYTITWNVKGATSTTEVNENTRPTAPSVKTCSESRVFMGWTTSSTVSGVAPATLYASSEVPNATAAATYYAVFADKITSGGGGSSTITFTPGTDTGSTSFEKDGVTCTMTTMNNSSYYQIYAGQSGTFTCSTANITKIEFTCTASGTSKYGPGNTTADVGTYSYEGSTGTWTGSSTSVTLTSTAQVRMTTLSVTTDGGTTTTYSNYSLSCNTAPITYVTVTFHKNDGTATTTTQNVAENTSTALAANPWSRTHYTFDEWNTKANGTGISYTNGESVNIDADLDLYAQWTEAPQVKVTFMKNGVEHYSQTNYVGEEITGLTTPTLTDCDDYTFEGWSESEYAQDNTSAAALVTPTVIPAAATTYYAVYRKTEGGGGGSNGTAEFAPSDFSEQGTSGIGSEISATVNGVTFACDKGFGTTQIRCYKDGTITISSLNTITDIAFTFSGSYTGGLSTSYTELSTTSWTQTLGSQARITALTVTYSGGSSTTYHTTSPACASCEATITITSNNDEWGTVNFVE